MTFTLAVSNAAGSATAGSVTVTDTLPAGVTFVSASGTGWTCGQVGGVVTCTRPSLAVGAAPAITIAVTAPLTNGTLSNTATITSNVPDKAAGNNSSTTSTTVTTAVTLTITGLTNGASITHTSPFLDLSGTASVLPSTRPQAPTAPRASVTTVTWANNRGGSGTADGTTSWRAQFIPLQPGANGITILATDSTGNTALSTLTVTVNELLYYLAEGATGPFFNFDLLLGNPNAVAAPVKITYLKEDGSTIVQQDTLAATSERTIRVNTVPGLATGAVSTVVTSTSGVPLIVERTMLWDAAAAPAGVYYGGHTAEAVSSPRTQWLFAEGSQGFFDTYLLLANANATPASATVTYLLEGAAPVVRTVTVGATSRVTLFAGLIPQLVGRSFGIQVTATQPIIAERAMYFSTGRFWEGGYESAGVTEAAKRWFLAEGATGSFFDTFVLVSNTNSGPATLTVTYLLSTGVSIVKTHVVPGNARITINLENEDARLASAAVSTTVVADVPVVVERAMYWAGAFTSWYEAHNAFGVTATGTGWGLAEGRVGTALGYETFILLANPSATPANVQITYLRGNGTTVVKSYVVPATSRFNVTVNADVPELANESFGAVVRVTNGVPIAVERALYWSAGGVFWTGGTNATATRLP